QRGSSAAVSVADGSMATCASSAFAAFASARWQPTRKFQEKKKRPGNISAIATMYYQLLPQMKNALAARRDKMIVPFSKMDHAVLKSLTDAGYLKSVEKEAIGKKNVLVVKFAKKGTMNDFKIISKPSRHFYADYRSLRSVKQGHGLAVL